MNSNTENRAPKKNPSAIRSTTSKPIYIDRNDPKYPGDWTHMVRLHCDGDLGDVRIQWYGARNYKVASFTPGRYIVLPGDSPKTEPERYVWVKTETVAFKEFQKQLAAAYEDGWDRI